jgi:hypothetical protein
VLASLLAVFHFRRAMHFLDRDMGRHDEERHHGRPAVWRQLSLPLATFILAGLWASSSVHHRGV